MSAAPNCAKGCVSPIWSLRVTDVMRGAPPAGVARPATASRDVTAQATRQRMDRLIRSSRTVGGTRGLLSTRRPPRLLRPSAIDRFVRDTVRWNCGRLRNADDERAECPPRGPAHRGGDALLR